ncbi:MAG TPA: triose-phosphate isomerase [Bacteroidia bacterium]|nr:triose-phosphate isomerase [Bacteroidia bacterium]
MRTKTIAANWKMNLDYFGGMKLLSEIIPMVKDEVSSDVKIIIAPPFVHLYSAAQLLNADNRISLAAQNCSSEDKGAFTGEVSAEMLSSAGVKHVLCGHSERRKIFQEDDSVIAEKVLQVLKHNMQPVFCCGETLAQREEKKHREVVTTQIEKALFSLDENQIQKIIIAYEPVWAIGTGVNATPEQAQEMHAFIRQLIKNKFNENISENISILYGGSVTPANAKNLFSCADVDGGLVGGASLNARDFVEIVKAAK